MQLAAPAKRSKVPLTGSNFGCPASLSSVAALGFALIAASRLRVLALMVRIATPRQIQELAMAALASEGRLHRQAGHPEPNRLSKHPSDAPKSTANLNKMEPNEEELCRKAPKRIQSSPVRFSDLR